MVLAVPNYGPDRPIRRLMLISAVSKPVDEIILRFFCDDSLQIGMLHDTWTESSASCQPEKKTIFFFFGSNRMRGVVPAVRVAQRSRL